VARILLAEAVGVDFDRIRAHLDAHESDAADARVREIESAIAVLAHSPRIGRPVDGDTRELVIGQGRQGYLALYEHVELLDLVVVLSLRHQREDGYASA
jgi:toxin ParE1/3/4